MRTAEPGYYNSLLNKELKAAAQSYEGDLEFSATCDRTGHVTIKLTLARGSAWKWKIQTVIAIEAGQLERLAASAFAFARQLGAI